MVTKKYVRKGSLGNKKGWCFVVFHDGACNVISALWTTKKLAQEKQEVFIKTGKLDTYGNAE